MVEQYPFKVLVLGSSPNRSKSHLGSSMVELAAVNRSVVGSNPTLGAILMLLPFPLNPFIL
jgi:hypothetical protein